MDERTRRFLCGAMAGTTATVLTYPFDVARARMAAHWSLAPKYPSVLKAFAEIWRSEGVAGFMRGLGPTLLGIVPYSGLSFMIFESGKAEWLRRNGADGQGRGEIPIHVKLAYGGVAGLVGQYCTYPLHVVRRRMQVDVPDNGRKQANHEESKSSKRSSPAGGRRAAGPGGSVSSGGPRAGLIDTFLQIYREEGVRRGLFKGASLTMLKGPVAVAVTFVMNDTVQKAMLEGRSRDPRDLEADQHFSADVPLPSKVQHAFRERDSKTTPLTEVLMDRPPTAVDRPSPVQLSALDSLFCGACAGAAAKTVIAPGDRIKILFQTNPHKRFTWRGVWETGRGIWCEAGLSGFWRGHGATLLRVCPSAAITYTCYPRYEAMLRKKFDTTNTNTHFHRFLAGACSGMTATTLTYPLDLLRAQYAASLGRHPPHQSYFKGMLKIYTQRGVRGLFQGLRPTLLGNAPYAGISFGVYETIKHANLGTIEFADRPLYVRLAAAACAGLVAQSATYPFDIVRRRMQVAGLKHGDFPQYRNEFHAFSKIAATEGVVQGLFKGLSMNYLKGPIAVAVSFNCNDFLRDRVGRWRAEGTFLWESSARKSCSRASRELVLSSWSRGR